MVGETEELTESFDHERPSRALRAKLSLRPLGISRNIPLVESGGARRRVIGWPMVWSPRRRNHKVYRREVPDADAQHEATCIQPNERT